MLLGKSFTELMQSSLQTLVASGLITNVSRGGIARAILEAVNQNIADYYQALDLNMTMAYVSTASGIYLDLIGDMLNCLRNQDEDDESYRYRITHQVYVATSANATAVRLRCLAVEGVRDIIIREFTHGTGSFSVYVIPESSYELQSLLTAVQVALDDCVALGVRALAVAPKMIPVRLQVNVIHRLGSIDAAMQAQIRREIMYYIENLTVGEELVINEIIERVMSVSAEIKDVKLSNFYVNSKPSLLTNRVLYWDEKFYPESIAVA